MDTLSPLILLHGNGYKALAATNSSDDLRFVMTELQGKIVRVGKGDFDVTVGFSDRNNEVGDLGRDFNRMVEQLRENREDVERLHRTQMSRAERLATLGELAAGLAHEIRNPLAGIAGVVEIVGRDLPVTSLACTVVEDVRLEIAQINRILTDFLQTARPHLPELHPSDLNGGTYSHAGMPASGLHSDQDRTPERPNSAKRRTRQRSDSPTGFEPLVERGSSD